jgi:hypothetical protein
MGYESFYTAVDRTQGGTKPGYIPFAGTGKRPVYGPKRSPFTMDHTAAGTLGSRPADGFANRLTNDVPHGSSE